VPSSPSSSSGPSPAQALRPPPQRDDDGLAEAVRASRDRPARAAAVTAMSGAGGRRAFVDASGTAVPLPARVQRVLAADPGIAELLRGHGVIPLGEEPDGPRHDGTAASLAALGPDVILVRVQSVDPADPARVRRIAALRRIAPVIAFDLDRHSDTTADLRALLGSTAGAC
jgi:ABC-type Fe3+-hydroxamate transport system substrate-binding protein